MIRLIKTILILSIVGIALIFWGGQRWLATPVEMSAPTVEVSIERGATARAIAHQLVKEGIHIQPDLFYYYLRFSGQGSAVRAGDYEFTVDDTPKTILDKLISGKQVSHLVRLPEGQRFSDFRLLLSSNERLKHATAEMSDAEVMKILGKEGMYPEGWFFPDTFQFHKGDSDLDILKRSLGQMEKTLAEMWNERAQDLAIKTPYEALILASIIEKEAGRDEDRFLVSGVFHNRLRKGMLLQTDPTVIYGVGDAYGGRLTRRNLDADTPYNTYTRAGLPPTPIAMPSKRSLLAAVHPAKTEALYFVARNASDNSSHFSANLRDHEAAVSYYLRGGNQKPRPSVGVSEK